MVLFLDAAHFVYGAFLGSVWCFARVFLRSPSGRQRFNVLGALDAVTRQAHLFTNETYITAQSVCALLNQLAAFYGPRKVPLTLFLDNARYQRCELVQAHARALGIDLEFLPTYSPNLNLIERYWRWVKKQCKRSRDEKLDILCEKIPMDRSKPLIPKISASRSWNARTPG